jgi:hypothetical protein
MILIGLGVYRKVICDYCPVTNLFRFKDLKDHHAVCNYRPVSCPKCKADIPFCRKKVSKLAVNYSLTL